MGLPREEHNQLVKAIAAGGKEAAEQCEAWAREAQAGKTPDISTGESGEFEPGSVSAAVIPALREYATSLGYTVAPLNPEALKALNHTGGSPLGYTIGAVPQASGIDHPPMHICVKDGMSSAATARVLVHEAGHVLLGHASSDPAMTMVRGMMRSARFAKFGDPEDPGEEIAVQLAAGAVCRLAEIGTGEFSVRYLAARMAHPLFLDDNDGGASNVEKVCTDAMRVATQVWPVVRDALRS